MLLLLNYLAMQEALEAFSHVGVLDHYPTQCKEPISLNIRTPPELNEAKFNIISY